MNQTAVLYALLLLMVAFWSGNYIGGKIALREFPALLLAALRIGIAGLAMLPLYIWERARSTPKKRSRRDVLHLLLLGLIGAALNQLFFIVGLSRTSVAHAALLIGLTPVQVLVIAALRGQERVTARKAAGMAIALAGVAVLTSFESSAGSGATLPGDAIVLLGGFCFALFTVFGKELTGRYSAITVNTYAYVGGGVVLLPLIFWGAARHYLSHAGAAAWLSAIYMALFPSVAAYLIYYHALAHMTASRVSAFSYLQPVFASIMGVAILGESLGAAVIAGGVVILSGVYLAESG